MAIDESTRNELVTEVFSSIVDRNFTLLRRFRGESSLATYLTIVARRIAVKRLQGMKVPGTKSSSEIATHSTAAAGTELRIDNQLRIDTQSPSAQAVPAPSATKPLSPNPEEAH
jgi:RNA polymerase sigma-70 factor (ECF subfamily)